MNDECSACATYKTEKNRLASATIDRGRSEDARESARAALQQVLTDEREHLKSDH